MIKRVELYYHSSLVDTFIGQSFNNIEEIVEAVTKRNAGFLGGYNLKVYTEEPKNYEFKTTYTYTAEEVK